MLNIFHRRNWVRMHEAFAPGHGALALVACVQEEVGELAAAVLGVEKEKKRKAKTREDVLDAVADAITYLSLIASHYGEDDLEGLLARTFDMVSERSGSIMTMAPSDEYVAGREYGRESNAEILDRRGPDWFRGVAAGLSEREKR